MAIFNYDANLTQYEALEKSYLKFGECLEEGYIECIGQLSGSVANGDVETTYISNISGRYVLTSEILTTYERIGMYATINQPFWRKTRYDTNIPYKTSLITNMSIKGLRKSDHNIISIGRISNSYTTSLTSANLDIMKNVDNESTYFGGIRLYGIDVYEYYNFKNISISIQGNVRFFGTEKELNDWLIMGDIPDNTTEFVMSTKLYESSNVLGNNGRLVNSTKTIFKKPASLDGKVCGYVANNIGNKMYDINIVYNADFKNNVNSVTQFFNDEKTDSTIDTFINPYHKYTNIRYDGSIYLYGTVLSETNIPIYSSEGDALSYLEGGNPIPVYEGGGGGNGTNETGETDNETTMNINAENSSTMSGVFIMTKAQMDNFANLLYTTDTGIITAIKEGLTLYGENPINFVVDAFYLPFDVSTFVNTIDVTQIRFGSYTANLTGKKVTKNNALVTIASVDVVGGYNDYRDYDFNYYLYLPYVGFVPLDIETIIYKTLTIKAFFDVRTGNIKYYIFAGLNLVKTFEGNIRVSMPLTSSDKVAQAGQYIKGIESVVSGTTNTVGEIGSAISTGGKSLLGGIGSGIPSIISGAIELQKGAPKSVSGNSSPSTAILDALYPYLIIEKPIYKNASSVRAEYNKPDMSVRKIGDTRGYGIFTDVMLETDADEEERNEILSLLSAGVIV